MSSNSNSGSYGFSATGGGSTINVAFGVTVLAALAVLIVLHRMFGSIRA